MTTRRWRRSTYHTTTTATTTTTSSSRSSKIITTDTPGARAHHHAGMAQVSQYPKTLFIVLSLSRHGGENCTLRGSRVLHCVYAYALTCAMY